MTFFYWLEISGFTSRSTMEIMQCQTDTRIKCVQAWLMIKIMRHFDRLATKCVQAQLIHEAATNEEKCEKCIRSEETWYSEASVIFSTASQRMSIYPLVDLLGSIIGVFQIGNFCSSLLWSMLWVPDWVPNWCHPIFWGPQDLPKVSDYGSFYGALTGAQNWVSRSGSAFKSPRGLCMRPAVGLALHLHILSSLCV